MQGPVRTRLLLTLIGLAVVVIGTTATILFAKGYRPNPSGNALNPTGILLAQSYPDGAQIYLNGQLNSATNSTLNLTPGQYSVEFKMDGFTTWKKDLAIVAGVVTRATAWLFPSVPSLRAVTAIGASHPAVSPDGTKVAYLLRQGSLTKLYTLDLTESPLGTINRESKLITTLPATANLQPITYNPIWSPDSRSLLLPASTSATIINLATAQITDVSDTLYLIISTWHQELEDQNQARLPLLPKSMRDLLATSSSQLVWSPKEDKVLYLATASASIPDNLIKPLPGSNTQPQSRLLSPGQVYVYDLEEDRNFLLGAGLPPTPADLVSQIGFYRPGGFSWFSTSNHLLKVNSNEVTIVEYDGQNPTLVYAGPLEENFAAPYPSTKQLLILTNLNPQTSPLPNLYAVSLR